jgi:hypothetical protein
MFPRRTSRTIAERIDTHALRLPSRLRQLRWQLGWAAFALAAVVPVTALLRGDKTIYQSGNVSVAHQFIANDCGRCHDRPGQTALRAVSLSHAARSVSQQACLACHAAPDHHAAPLPAARCTQCHREHEGAGELSRVHSAFCTECHADLPASASFVREVPSFAEHPEFAVLRPASDPQIGSEHELQRLAEPDPQTGRWRDKAAIRLNHKAHLNPQGIPAQPGGGEGAPLERMECQSCHQPDGASGNFQPIAFEQHCRRCHADQLAFAGVQASPLRDLEPLPHREPEAVLGVLRERLAKALQDTPAGIDPPQREQPLRRFFPGLPERKPLAESQTQTLARQLQLADGLLLATKADSAAAGAGCAYCHAVTRDAQQVRITPPAIPSRWLPHSRFRHDAHRQLSCVACHAETPNSTATADVLLPSIQICHKCHQAEAPQSRLVGSAGSARADCAQCHDYHIRTRESWDGKHAVP